MTKYNFMGKRKAFGIVSVILVIVCAIYVATMGVPKNVDFEGGTKMTVKFAKEGMDISTVRETITAHEPKATIIREEVPGVSQFSLKIKRPDVEKGKESEASLQRRRNLEEAFAELNNEEQNYINLVRAMSVEDLAGRMLAENIYGLDVADTVKEQTYNELAAKVKGAASSASTLKELAAVDSENAQTLAIALNNELFVALDHITTDALAARLLEYDPLGRGVSGDYSDIAQHVESVRSQNNDFITNMESLAFGDLVSADEATKLDLFFNNHFTISQYRIISNETFSPSIAAELLKHAYNAVFLAIIGILLYIAVRFDANYAVSSVVALVHDVVIALGVFAFVGHIVEFELSNPVVAAFLTIVGYSLNDTIVVFDRIRDNRSDIKNVDLADLMNTSINQTLSRTIVTSLTTFFVVVVIFIFTTGTLRDFAFPLLIGIIVGTYSSIFVASPTLLFLTERQSIKKLVALDFKGFFTSLVKAPQKARG